LGILFYLLFKLIFGKKLAAKRQPFADSPSKQPLQDVLVEDPVCHTFVPKGQAQPLLLEGEKYYFCSDECRKKFIKLKEPN
jgi:YHS domain-containing protein